MNEVILSGSAVYGVGGGPVNSTMGLLGEGLPSVVKLGRAAPRARKAPVQLEEHVSPFVAGAFPEKVDWTAKAGPSLSRMYRNDAKGCCVISGKYHKLGVLTANDTATCLTVSDSVIDRMYDRLKAGPGDSGCVITDVLDYFRGTGLPDDSGKTYKIDGYAAVRNTNAELVKAALYLFGNLTLGINLPSDWTNNSVWRPTNSQIVGGHDVCAVGYDTSGVYVSSWGRVYLITWDAFTSTRWLEETWVVLAPAWYNDDKLSPNGVNVASLSDALKKIGQGTVPSVDPVPPSPPVPPVPPVTDETLIELTLPNLPVVDSWGRPAGYARGGVYAARFKIRPKGDPQMVSLTPVEGK